MSIGTFIIFVRYIFAYYALYILLSMKYSVYFNCPVSFVNYIEQYIVPYYGMPVSRVIFIYRIHVRLCTQIIYTAAQIADKFRCCARSEAILKLK